MATIGAVVIITTVNDIVGGESTAGAAANWGWV